MQLADFSYDLPDHLIARYPLPERSASRLLVLPATGEPQDRMVRDLPDLLQAGDLLVLNDTRVIKARLHGQKASGGAVEMLVERIVTPTTALAHLRASNAPKAGQVLRFAQGQISVTVHCRQDNLFAVEFDQPILPALEQYGELPIPRILIVRRMIATKHAIRRCFTIRAKRRVWLHQRRAYILMMRYLQHSMPKGLNGRL
jgi:S-adenosylmethionine:tRNA ribosyltransferase-isomerase